MKSNFLTLCKYEVKKIVGFSGARKKKKDFLSLILSTLITLAIAAAFVFFLSIIAKNYAEVKINKVSDPLSRAAEFMNLIYTAVIAVLTVVCLERMRKVIAKSAETQVFLRLPVTPQSIFISKMLVLVAEIYIVALVLMIPSCIVVSGMLDTGASFWLYSFVVWLVLPIVPIFISSALVIPYLKLVDYLMRTYWLLFGVVTSVLVGAFVVYSKILSVVQGLLETGSIKFLFNEQFINALQTLRRVTYPANIFTDITLGINVLVPLLIVVGGSALLAVGVYFIIKTMFYSVLYKDDKRRKGNSKGKKFRKSSSATALVKKEFINVFRTPGHMFSYFAIAAAMPIMVYSCYTMFYSLIENTLGLHVDFSLALLIVLVFGVLTNTFCSTNVSRDGLSALSAKIYPVKPEKIMLSKVAFCMIVSSASVALSVTLLVILTPLGVPNGIAVAAFGIMFSAAQIFIATRLDLNHAHVASGPAEAERAADKTTTKVVSIGLLFATLVGVSSLVLSLLSSAGGDVLRLVISYLIPFVITSAYLALAVLYYKHKIEESFHNLVS